MTEPKYNEYDAIRDLEKLGVKFKHAPQKIADRSGASLGLGSLGKFDFLVNYCGYSEIYTPQHSFIKRGYRHYFKAA